jgi:hypothetical protein
MPKKIFIMNFEEISKEHKCEKTPYHKAYTDMFEGYRDKDLKLLEIGISEGNSMKVWKEYFPKAELYGVDINSECTSELAKCFIGDQADDGFMKKIGEEHGKFDIIIDDGGHHCHQHVKSFKTLFPYLKDGGYYVIEDLHTAYWSEYGGNREGTSESVKFIKGLVDVVNAGGRWMKNSPNDHVPISEIHLYNSIIFVKKWKD